MTVRPLSSEFSKKAELELNETPKKLEDGIQHLKDWIKKQPHLRARTDDQWLAAFLRGCKHSLERSKEKIDLYYSLRNTAPDLFAFTPKNPKFKELLKSGAMIVLPKLSSPLAPRVVIVKPGLYDPNKIGSSDLFSYSHIIQQIMYIEDDGFVVNGCIYVIDFEGTTMSHVLQMTPIQIKKLVVAGQDASPLRLKSFHNINFMPILDTILNLGIRLLNEKLKKRIFVHGKGIDSLSKYIPKEILPKEYGGDGGPVQEIIDYWLKKIDEYGPWLEEDQQYGTDESLRQGTPKTAADMFGLEGSFRKLEVD